MICFTELETVILKYLWKYKRPADTETKRIQHCVFSQFYGVGSFFTPNRNYKQAWRRSLTTYFWPPSIPRGWYQGIKVPVHFFKFYCVLRSWNSSTQGPKHLLPLWTSSTNGIFKLFFFFCGERKPSSLLSFSLYPSAEYHQPVCAILPALFAVCSVTATNDQNDSATEF